MPITEAQVVDFFKRLLSVEGYLESAEKRQILRSLRTIYFYPDNSLDALDRLIASNGNDATALATLYEIFGRTREEVSSAIKFLTSESVRTNLKIPLEVLHAIREATSLKEGMRAYFTSMFFAVVLTNDKAEIKAAAVEAKRDILELNSKLREIETLLGKENG